MCIELRCGYSSQTLTKAIAYCKIAIYLCLISTIAIFGLILEIKNAEVRRIQQLSDSDLDITNVVVSTTTKPSLSPAATDFNKAFAEEEEIISTANITATTEKTILTNDQNDIEGNLEHDFTHFRKISHPIRALCILWIIVNLVTGLIFSIVLLQGAQERNLFKVKIWFFVTIISYLLWIPIYAFGTCHAKDPMSVLMFGFMIYMLGGVCLWIVSGFIEELRIESISYRAGYKDIFVPFYKI